MFTRDSAFISFIIKYRKILITFFLFLLLASISFLIYKSFSYQREKEAYNKFYPLQSKFKKALEKTLEKIEKETPKNKKKDSKFANLFGEQKKVLSQKNLQENLLEEVRSYKEFIQNHGRKKGASVLAALELGSLFIDAKDFKSAKELLFPFLDKVSSKNTMESLLLMQLGNSLMELKEWESAIKAFSKIFKNKVNAYLHPIVMTKMGLCYEKMNKFDEAKKIYNDVLKKFPKSFSASHAQSYLNFTSLNPSFGKEKEMEKVK